MIWSPKPPEDYVFVSTLTGKKFNPGTPTDVATWNLHWLFDYEAHCALDGTLQGVTNHFTLSKETAKVHAAIIEDVEANLYGIKELAETCWPVEFIDKMMRRPYQHTMLYSFGGAEAWKQARTAAEKLEIGLAGKVEAARDDAVKVIQSARIFEFKRKA